MLVESAAPAGTGAPRVVAQPWNAPLLVAGIISAPSLHESLWSESAERQEERLDGLQADDERVAGVLEGLRPTNVEHVAQTRAVREETLDATAARNARREWSQQGSGQSSGNFRSLLANARAISAGPSVPTAVGSTVPTAGLETAVSDRVSGNPSAAAPGPSNNGSAAPVHIGGAEPAPLTAMATGRDESSLPSPLSTTPPVSVARTIHSALSSALSASATNVAAAPRADAGPSPGSPATSTGASPSVSGANGAAGEKSDSGGAHASRPDPEGDQETAGPDADDRAENVERVLRVLRGSLRREHTTTVIRMDPPELGALRLELDLRKEVLTLRMSAETAAAQDLLRDELDALRRGLEAAGIRLERVEIHPLAPAQDATPFGAFGGSAQRRGESSGESAGRPGGVTTVKRPDRSTNEPQPAAAGHAALVHGSARLNIVV
jgi:hypothetical protein